jgi:hypothetical protein
MPDKYKCHKIRYEPTDQSIVYQLSFIIPTATHWYYMLLDCQVRYSVIFQLLDKCQISIFSKLSLSKVSLKINGPIICTPNPANVKQSLSNYSKLKAVDMSKAEILPFHLDMFPHYYNKTNCNIKYILTLIFLFFRHKSLNCYINDALFHLLSWTTKSSLIISMFFTRQYQLSDSKINEQFFFSSLISCKQLETICRLLWWISLWYCQHSAFCLI